MARRNSRKRSAVFVRVMVTVWLLVLAGILLVVGLWGWALLPLAGAVANSMIAYRTYRVSLR